MSDALLELSGVRVEYAGRIVLDVDRLTLERGEILAIIGPNGAGKSTLLRVAGLLERPSAGSVALDGVPVAHSAALLPLRRRFASVFQEPLLMDASVRRNVELGLRLRRVRRPIARERAARWLERFGIAHLADRSARALSGGEAQRAALARAFAVEPEVLLLDEPFAALDLPTREALLRDLQRLLRESGMTTVFVTHDRTEALWLGDRVAVILDHRLAQIGPPEVVFGRPISEPVARFVGAENLIAGSVVSKHGGLLTVEAVGCVIQAPGTAVAGSAVYACVRPEDVVLSAGWEGQRDSALNRLCGRVLGVETMGAQVRVSIQTGGTEIVALITRRSAEELGIVAGVPVTASFKASGVHLIPRR